jgi:pyruvate dehydrogenase (quinone)
MTKRVADLLVETLQAAGVKTCYGIVGDTLNQIAHAIDRSKIDWVHVRHEEAGAFAAAAEALLTGHLTACAGSCGPGSLHFINGLYEANRNRAPVILIATQIVRQDLGFESIQEIDFDDVFKGCSVYCEMIVTPEQARRKTVAACQAALTKRGVAVIVVPADVANAASHDEPPYAVHARRPLIRPSDADLDQIAAILNKSKAITIYAGAGCAGAHDEVVATAARLKAPMAHTSRGKDFLEYDNPYNVGMTGIIGGSAGYHAILDCDVLLLLGADFAWTQFYPDGVTIIQIDADPTHIGRRHPVTIGAVGDIKTTLKALLPHLKQHEDNAFLAGHVERHRKDVARAKAETVSGPDSAISGTYLTKIINKHAADDALFTLHVKVKPMQLVTPPSPFVSPEAVVGMAVYTARAMLHGKGHDVWEMMVENIP